jgi:hypothetical protein
MLTMKVNCLVNVCLNSTNVLQLHEVWEKVRLNFRLMTEFSSTKQTLKFA